MRIIIPKYDVGKTVTAKSWKKLYKDASSNQILIVPDLFIKILFTQPRNSQPVRSSVDRPSDRFLQFPNAFSSGHWIILDLQWARASVSMRDTQYVVNTLFTYMCRWSTNGINPQIEKFAVVNITMSRSSVFNLISFSCLTIVLTLVLIGSKEGLKPINKTFKYSDDCVALTINLC